MTMSGYGGEKIFFLVTKFGEIKLVIVERISENKIVYRDVSPFRTMPKIAVKGGDGPDFFAHEQDADKAARTIKLKKSLKKLEKRHAKR